MSLHSFTISEEAATYASTAAQDEHETADERRATTRADAAWQDARGIADHPALTNLDIGGGVKDSTDPQYADEPFIAFLNETLKAGGLDPSISLLATWWGP